MAKVACIRVIWDRDRMWHLPPVRCWVTGQEMVIKFREVHVVPEPGWPAGRKGMSLAGAWAQFGKASDADGMLILDADVVIDSDMVVAMREAIDSDPLSVWTAPVKLWPIGTGRDHWVWSHWEHDASQQVDDVANWFGFSFTYLPKRLIEHCVKLRPGLSSWTFPIVDASFAKQARALGIPGRVVRDCWPVHLHW
jgi:hypothetical protein